MTRGKIGPLSGLSYICGGGLPWELIVYFSHDSMGDTEIQIGENFTKWPNISTDREKP